MKERDFNYKGMFGFEDGNEIFFIELSNSTINILDSGSLVSKKSYHINKLIKRIRNSANSWFLLDVADNQLLKLDKLSCEQLNSIDGLYCKGQVFEEMVIVNSFNERRIIEFDAQSFCELWHVDGEAGSIYIESKDYILFAPMDELMNQDRTKLRVIKRETGMELPTSKLPNIEIDKILSIQSDIVYLVSKKGMVFKFNFLSEELTDISSQVNEQSFVGSKDFKLHNNQFVSLTNAFFSELDLSTNTYSIFKYNRDTKEYVKGASTFDYNEQDIWIQQFYPYKNHLFFTGHYFGWPNKEQIAGVFNIRDRRIVEMNSKVLPKNAFFGKMGINVTDKYFFCKDSDGNFHCYEHEINFINS